jgi:hypothetical protein
MVTYSRVDVHSKKKKKKIYSVVTTIRMGTILALLYYSPPLAGVYLAGEAVVGLADHDPQLFMFMVGTLVVLVFYVLAILACFSCCCCMCACIEVCETNKQLRHVRGGERASLTGDVACVRYK